LTRVLLTGGSGFVGSALSMRLVARGDRVTACVRTVPAAPVQGVRYLTVDDRLEAPGLSDALAQSDVVVHLVARTHSADLADPTALDLYRRINVDMTRALTRKCLQAGVRRFVFLSSVKVHGERSDLRGFREDDVPRPEDVYGQTKLEAEQALARETSGTTLAYTIVRPPLVYGPGVKANFLRMIRAIDRGLPLPLASIRNARSLVGLPNLCDFIVTAMEHPAACGETFLVSDRERPSTPQLLEAIGTALGRPVRLMPVPAAVLAAVARLLGRQGELQRLTGTLVVDTTKAERLLGWRAPFSLDEQLREAVDDYRRGAAR
jgi:nucleoside-diphosphate-sugar epimerase